MSILHQERPRDIGSSRTCESDARKAGENDIGVTEGMLFRSGSTERGRETHTRAIDLVTVNALASVRHRNPGIPQREFNTNAGFFGGAADEEG